MSDINNQVVEAISAIKELTVEIKNLVKSHDETKDDVRDLTKRVSEVEKEQAGEKKLLEIVERNQTQNKQLAYTIIGSLVVAGVVGIVSFVKYTGG